MSASTDDLAAERALHGRAVVRIEARGKPKPNGPAPHEGDSDDDQFGAGILTYEQAANANQNEQERKDAPGAGCRWPTKLLKRPEAQPVEAERCGRLSRRPSPAEPQDSEKTRRHTEVRQKPDPARCPRRVHPPQPRPARPCRAEIWD